MAVIITPASQAHPTLCPASPGLGRIIPGVGRPGGRLVLGDRWVIVTDGRLVLGDRWVIVTDGWLVLGDRWVIVTDGRLVLGDRWVIVTLWLAGVG